MSDPDRSDAAGGADVGYARAMQSHQLRALLDRDLLALYSAIGELGPAPIERIARLVDEPIPVVETRVQVLAEVGLVCTDDGRTGGAARWSRTPMLISPNDVDADPAARTAAHTLAVAVMDARAREVDAYFFEGAERHERAFLDAALFNATHLELTAVELQELVTAVRSVLERFETIGRRDDPPRGAERIAVHFNAFPSARSADAG